MPSTSIEKRHLNQTCTYWANPVAGGRGNYTFDEPTTLDCRWVDGEDLIIDEQGRETLCRGPVFLGQDVKAEEYLYLGTSTEDNPKDVAGAYKIVKFEKIPNLGATKFVRKVWLSKA